MRPPIHPDSPLHFLKTHARVEGDQLLRYRVENRVDAHVRKAAHGIIAAVRATLIFADDGNPVGVVTVRAQASSVIDENAHVVAELRPGNSFWQILVKEWSPGSGEIYLSVRRRHGQCQYG